MPDDNIPGEGESFGVEFGEVEVGNEVSHDSYSVEYESSCVLKTADRPLIVTRDFDVFTTETSCSIFDGSSQGSHVNLPEDEES